MNLITKFYPKKGTAKVRRINKRQLFALSALLVLFMLAIPSFAQAAAPYTSIGSAVVDGNTGEWDLTDHTDDFFADMTRAGKVDARHPIESKAYLRYDPATQIMYVLVLTQPGIPAVIKADDAWAAINGISHKVFTGASVNDATQPNFAWVEKGYDGHNNHAKGYEASFRLAQGNYQIIIHLKVLDDGECETSATQGLKCGIDLFVVPETPIFTTLIGTLAAGGAFLAYKKRSSLHI